MSRPGRFFSSTVALAVAAGGLGVGAANLKRHAGGSRATELPSPEIAPVVTVVTPEPPSAEAGFAPALDDEEPTTLYEQRERLFRELAQELKLSPKAISRVRAVFAGSPILGQGNPAVSKHPMTRRECRRVREDAGLQPAHVAACGGPNMVPVYDRDHGETAADARVCIDQFEFPDIPCAYPVVQVRAREAALLCDAVGKRLCDAHEWEGACAGSVELSSREYRWGWPREASNYAHNVTRTKVWAYGPTKNHALCATGSFVTPGCDGGGFTTCGSNTYPAGAFPQCQSAFGVFDQHGNAAEHMNLPTMPEELASQGGDGFTEMKGSWFAFQKTEAHEDDCRYRAPAWHETRVMNEKSHMNYHLGFRCCKDVDTPPR